jgi:hypothetical protein
LTLYELHQNLKNLIWNLVLQGLMPLWCKIPIGPLSKQ